MAQLAQLANERLSRGQADDTRRMLGVLERQAQSSHELVVALLTLARAGTASMQRQAIDAAQVARSAVQDLGADGTRVVLLDLPEVAADPTLLRQVFVNLMANALKFSAGCASAEVLVGAVDCMGATVFFVRDNGVGFDESQSRLLFTPFARPHGARFAGAGVGLSIVKRIVEAHAGEVWATAQPGRGSSFFFTLAGTDPLASASLRRCAEELCGARVGKVAA